MLQLQQRSMSYVAKARLLQKLKEDNGFCEEQLDFGQFLLYSKENDENNNYFMTFSINILRAFKVSAYFIDIVKL